MPVASALMVRSAWTWFAVGLALGWILAARRALGWWMDLGPLICSSHVHMLLVGFLAQWVMGIAFWFYPRQPQGPYAPHHRRALAAWALLNAGVLARAVTDAVIVHRRSPAWSWAYMGSVTLQVAAGLLFVTAVWSRVVCSLRLPEGRVREKRLLTAARKVWSGEEVE